MADYQLRTFTLPKDLKEIFTAELWSRGALGFEVHEVDVTQQRLDAYFCQPLPAELTALDLEAWRRRGVREVASQAFAERDWLADYRATVEPFDVGEGFRVDPRDQTVQDETRLVDNRRILKIPARTAFGTGSHESTRLVIRWLEELDLTGRSVLDVGTGTGLLAFIAEILGADHVVGFDVDAQAVCLARTNAGLNGASPQLFAGGVGALKAAPRFDLALVNILPENIFHEIPKLLSVLRPGACVISSGNLVSRRDELLARWQGWGCSVEGEKREADWAAWLLAAPKPDCDLVLGEGS